METKKTSPKGRSRRIFTEEFKRDAVNLVVVQGYSFKAAADAVGVSSRSLREWHDKFARESQRKTFGFKNIATPSLWRPCAEE